ncbi:MAG: hypothetical protein Q9181_007970 [Wetmoreana brouardii]
MTRLVRLQSVYQSINENSLDKHTFQEFSISQEAYAMSREFIKMSSRSNFPWSEIKEFFENPYFTRGWIFQEVIVSRDVSFFGCLANGDLIIADRDTLYGAVSFISMLRTFLRAHFVKKDDKLIPDAPRSNEEVATMSHLVTSMVWLYDLNVQIYFMLLGGRSEWQSDDGFELKDMLLHSRQCNVTDKVDKVYAFLGLLKSGHSIIPNYKTSKSAADVFTDAAKSEICRNWDLNFLSYAEDTTPVMRACLPSWVPDWDLKGPSTSLILRLQGYPCRPNASSMAVVEPEFLPSVEGRPDRLLRTQALIIDQVALPETLGTTAQRSASWEECLSLWGKCAGLTLDEPNFRRKYGQYLLGGSKLAAFWSSILRGIISFQDVEEKLSGNFEGPGHVKVLANQIAERHNFTTANALLSMAVDQKYVYDAGWKFFHSPKGYYGLVRSRVQPTDSLCVLIGSDVPFVLRPRDEKSYELVGEAYIQGLMQGEAMEMLEARDLELTSVTLH